MIKTTTPIDVITILYMGLSAGYILAGYNKIENIESLFLMRVGVLVFMFFLLYAESKLKFTKIKWFVSFLRNVYPFFFLNYFYTETHYTKNNLFPQDIDAVFASAEQSIWGFQPSLQFSEHVNNPLFRELMYMGYFSFYLMIPTLCIAFYLKNKNTAKQPLFIMACSFYLFYCLYHFIPVLGPQYYFNSYAYNMEPRYFFGSIMHYLQIHVEYPTGAFPSSHVGMAFVFCYVTYHWHKTLFKIVLPLALCICFATVYIKEHYLIDVLAGLATAPVFIYLSKKIHTLIEACLLSFKKEESCLS
ncbi:MAG: phosphatase PAP2 family protein [Bacteroidetes bacterium]|nr:phosphatase PAP2 family protein [Bacteroidota bacterium]